MEVWKLSAGWKELEECKVKLRDLGKLLKVQRQNFFKELGRLLNYVLEKHVPRRKRKKTAELDRMGSRKKRKGGGGVSAAVPSPEDLVIGQYPPMACTKDLMQSLSSSVLLSFCNQLNLLEAVGLAGGVGVPPITMKRIEETRTKLLNRTNTLTIAKSK